MRVDLKRGEQALGVELELTPEERQVIKDRDLASLPIYGEYILADLDLGISINVASAVEMVQAEIAVTTALSTLENYLPKPEPEPEKAEPVQVEPEPAPPPSPVGKTLNERARNVLDVLIPFLFFLTAIAIVQLHGRINRMEKELASAPTAEAQLPIPRYRLKEPEPTKE